MKHSMHTTIGVLQRRGIADPVEEFAFAPPRKWRFDYCWPEFMLALEIEGLTREGGRHQRIEGYARDLKKYNAAVLLGWRVLRATPQQVESGEALAWLEEFFGEQQHG